MDKLKYIKLENEDGTYSDAIPISVDGQYITIDEYSLSEIIAAQDEKIDEVLEIVGDIEESLSSI